MEPVYYGGEPQENLVRKLNRLEVRLLYIGTKKYEKFSANSIKNSTKALWISIDNYCLSLGESNIFGISVLNFG